MPTQFARTGSAHEAFIRRSIEIAAQARSRGNHPFGALLVDESGHILTTAENTVVTERDPTCHAEMNLIRLAHTMLSCEVIAAATLYTSTEPCVMCCGAIHWAGIPKVVFGCTAEALGRIVGSSDFLIPCRETFAKTTQPKVEVVGPVIEAEAVMVHEGFWR